MIRGICVFLCVPLALAACAGDETVAAYGAADRVWHVQEIDGEAYEADATLTFPEKGRIAGSAPCNSYSADMTVPYPWFEVGPLISTKALCPQIEAETRFLDVLSEMRLSEVLGDTMILSAPGGRSITLKAGG